MGVPKFFRWINERYPCISELIRDYQIPEFDNLYLDMNGIIHVCSHPNDFDPHFRISEEKIFKDIFHYIEILFRMIKPRKVFFMAVDGVAPRAKMNQQRGRRFRSAKEAEILERKAKEKGEALPKESRFDSNCITPGTEFMVRLHEQLKYFVVNMVSTDKLWKNVTVILSGHETPGEGEHKIMDFIRYSKSQPDYNPNTRHCLYGLDADLIMLGLCSHEPYFSLLREEVKYGSKQKRMSTPEETNFYLLHLSLMRGYLEHEFSELKEKLPFGFDVENIIDDWVLMGFLVGNDFIPHLPNMHIASGALVVLYKAYIDVLPSLGGYINEAGTLNIERFASYMKKLSKYDMEHFQTAYADLKLFEAKTGRRPGTERKSYKPEAEGEEKPFNPELEQLIKATNEMVGEEEDYDESESEATYTDEEEEKENILLEFDQHKKDYYMNKLEYDSVTPEVMQSQAQGYVRAIQWNLNYYYNGVCSWSWYYPHHYAPYISDIHDFSGLNLEFEMGEPFLPYQQLLAVLPAASKCLLPTPYRDLMTNEKSALKAYYPEEFRTDMNGKRQEWEAVVLIPFIDEKSLLEAMAPLEQCLTEDERERNKHGPMLIYKYTSKNLGEYSAPDHFTSVKNNHALMKAVPHSDLHVEKKHLIRGLYPGTCLDIYYPGFPTMNYIPHTASLCKGKVAVFDQPSREDNMMLNIVNQGKPSPKEVAKHLLGESIYVAWPHLIEAKVISVSSQKMKYRLEEDGNMKAEESSAERQWIEQRKQIEESYQNKKGVIIGQTSILVHATPRIGFKHVFLSSGVKLQKQWSSTSNAYALQTTVKDILSNETVDSAIQNVSDIFPKGEKCFMLGQPLYGAMGEIVETSSEQRSGRVKVNMKVLPEPDISSVKRFSADNRVHYLHGGQAAQRLGISPHLWSRITGTIYVSQEEGTLKVNIGLNLKFSKKNVEVPGYTRKDGPIWLYSLKSVDLVQQYMCQFPELFQRLNQITDNVILARNLFPSNGWQQVTEISAWLKDQKHFSIEKRPCGSIHLEPDIILALESTLEEYNKYASKEKNVLMQVKPHLLFRYELQCGNIPPDPSAKHQLFDRIINVRSGYTVPLGLKGTIIGIRQTGSSDADIVYDIIFDHPFPWGLKLECSVERCYSLTAVAFINVDYGLRQQREKMKSGKPTAVVQPSGSVNTHKPQSAILPLNPMGILSSNLFTPTWAKGGQQMRPASAFASWGAGSGQQTCTPLPLHKGVPFLGSSSPRQQHPASSKQKPNAEFEALWTNLQKIKPSSGNVSVNIPVKVADSSVDTKLKTEDQAESCTELLKKMLRIPAEDEPNVNADSHGIPQKQLISHKPLGEDNVSKSNCVKLLEIFQATGLGIPRYTYVDNADGSTCAQVRLPDGTSFSGENSATKELASESAAGTALVQMMLLKKRDLGQSTLPSSPRMRQNHAFPGSLPTPPQQWFQKNNNSNNNGNNGRYKQQQWRQPSLGMSAGSSPQMQQGNRQNYQHMNPFPQQHQNFHTPPRTNWRSQGLGPSPTQGATGSWRVQTHNSPFVPLQAVKNRPVKGQQIANSPQHPKKNSWPVSSSNTSSIQSAAVPPLSTAEADIAISSTSFTPTSLIPKTDGKETKLRKSRIAAKFSNIPDSQVPQDGSNMNQ